MNNGNGSGIEIDLVGQLHAALGRIASRLDSDAEQKRRELERARSLSPIDVRIAASAVIPTPAVDIGLSFDGPDAGFYWILRRIVIGGMQWSSTLAGSFELYVTGLSGTRGSPHIGPQTVAGVRNMAELVDANASFPFRNYYSPHQIIIQENETLVAVVHGPTQNQQVVTAAQVQVMRTAAAAGIIEE